MLDSSLGGFASGLGGGGSEYAIKQLAAPAEKKIVQIKLAPKGDKWKWGDLAKFELEDSAGGKHKPIGG